MTTEQQQPARAPAVPPLPEFIATRSSNVHGIAFHDGALWIRFQGGKVYRYTGADPAALRAHYDAMLGAESVGRYFQQHLRTNAAINCQRIEFCAACGASVPPRDGEGVCNVCVPGAGEPPRATAVQQHENNDGV